MPIAHETQRMDSQTALGLAIKRLRENGPTGVFIPQEDLAEAAGIGQGGLSKIESGKQDVPTKKLAKIAHCIGVPVSRLWADAEELMGGGATAIEASATAKPIKPRASPVDINIDALRASIGAVAVAVTSTRQGAGEILLAQIEEIGKERPEFLEKEGSVVLLKQVVEAALAEQRAKARKRPRGRGGV